MTPRSQQTLKIGLAQISPIWLQREATIVKVKEYIIKAAKQGCDLVTFGETLIPGYTFWVEPTHGANFQDELQKQVFAHYSEQAIDFERGDLAPLERVCAEYKIACYIGIVERANNRSGHSVYCTLVYIDKTGQIQSTHRKLMPTHEERLVWSIGDGHGLRTHSLGAFTLGGLNCWENWMPLSRTALYAQGEDLHVAVWPGGDHNTHDITRFAAKENRMYVVSVSGLMRKEDIPSDLPFYQDIIDHMPEKMANGASCVAGPDGEWLLEPQVDIEDLFVVEIDHARVREERSLFDPTGHYSRPDVTRLIVDRKRQSLVEFED